MAGPEGDKLIRVNMTDQTVSIEDFPQAWKYHGGRSLSAKILLQDCDPTCDPLGPGNVLVMAPGVVSGTTAPTSGRISIGGKSPLTGGIKEANAGGNPGQHLMKLGYRAVIVEGPAADPEKRYGLEVLTDGVRVVEADDYKGMWNYALLREASFRLSKSASAITIGPAGEMQLSGASVACTDQDKERRPARHAARGGLGSRDGLEGPQVGPRRPRQGAPCASRPIQARASMPRTRPTRRTISRPADVRQVRHEFRRSDGEHAQYLRVQEPHRGPAITRRRDPRRQAYRRELRDPGRRACTTA